MKTVVLTSSSSSSSSAKSSTTTTTATACTTDGDRSETRDSCYFPGCRKDANCNCAICLDSINATLDLIPKTINRSSKPLPKSPIPFNPSIFATPRLVNPRVTVSPPLNSRARMGFDEKVKRKKREKGLGCFLMRFFLGLGLIFLAEFGFSWAVSRVLNPQFSPDIVRDLAEESWVYEDVEGKLDFLKKELQILVNGKVSSCSLNDSVWEINQKHLLLNSRCTLYKSATEEVSIWGWPLQTAGLLTAEFSSRSFTILSGRVAEWSDGKISYSTRKANTSWVLEKWSASAVQLHPNTWILEYTRSSVVENARMISAAMEFLKFRLSKEVKRMMKQQFWVFPDFGEQYDVFSIGDSVKTPT